MEIYLVRHPRPSRSDGLCYGRTDLAVEPHVVAAALASLHSRFTAAILRQALIFTSPALRCLRLAQALAAPREPGIAQELQEIDFGVWEGKPWESVPRAELDAWACDVWTYRPGGGESAAMVAARWRRWALRITARDAVSHNPVIAMTHAGLIRVALAGGRPCGLDLTREIPYGSVHRVDLNAAGVETSPACTP
jgi:alpha-ribazole phosphatase